jgi:PAS domain S-box-containing protein
MRKGVSMDIGAYWKTITKTLHDGLLVIDPKGQILAVNPAAERLTGYSSAELIGQSCRILDCTGCDIIGKGAGEHWCSLYSAGQVRDKKCLITNKDKRALNIIKNASVLHDDHGQIIGAIETLTDITTFVQQQREIESLRKSCRLDEGYHGLRGDSAPMQRLIDLIESLAPSHAPVLILGQSGTGKELVARAIHEAGPRGNKPFIKVNCAALNENLLESELFGHVKGAFTGAERTRIGRFEAAHGGTIFLDEIGDIPLATQVKLLRVLEEKRIERVGDHKTIAVDVRIVTATNKNLEALIDQGDFREDLFFRISVFPLQCPTLAQRREDIPLIVRDFIQEFSQKSAKQITGLTSQAMETLLAYDWPGNVRELRNAVEYAFVLCPAGRIDVEDLPSKVTGQNMCLPNTASEETSFGRQRDELLQVLRASGGNQSEAARRLGVSRVTIWKRIKKYRINISTDFL